MANQRSGASRGSTSTGARFRNLEPAAPIPISDGACASTAPGGGAAGSDTAAVALDVLACLRRAGSRADAHLKQTQKAKRRQTQRSSKIRADAEALLSTDVLLDIAKRRPDAGAIICSHCATSLRLADVLPSSSTSEPPARTRRLSGAFTSIGSRPNAPPMSASVAESRRELEPVASPPDETQSQQSSLLEALCEAGDDAAADAAALAAASATDDDEDADNSNHVPTSPVSEAEEKSTDDSAAPSLAP